MRRARRSGLDMIGPLHEVDEDASRGLRVDEGDLRSARARPRLLVDDVKPRRPGVPHGLFDVGDPQGDVMQAGAAPRHERGDVPLVDHFLLAVGHAILQDFEVRVAHPGEGRAQAAIRILFLEVVDLQAELSPKISMCLPKSAEAIPMWSMPRILMLTPPACAG